MALHSGNRFHPEVKDRVIISLHFPALRRRLDRESSNGNQAVEEMAIRLRRGADGGLTLCLKQLLSVIIHEIGPNVLDSSNSSNYRFYMYIYGRMCTCFQARRRQNIDAAKEMQMTVFTANSVNQPAFKQNRMLLNASLRHAGVRYLCLCLVQTQSWGCLQCFTS